jgi:hypothetical protein
MKEAVRLGSALSVIPAKAEPVAAEVG